MVQYSPKLDGTFGALADPTRRGILDMTLTGIKKHVRVLETAGFVTTEKIGRVRHCRLGSRRLDDEAAWITAYRRMLEGRLNRLGEFLERTRRKS
jgi:DNA-binding transcriptional ArsR family regulator